MKLIGILRSPYVRRTAVSLNAMGMTFELDAVPVFDKPELVTKYNPLTRVPALVLDDGEALIDSSVILDALDEPGIAPTTHLMLGSACWDAGSTTCIHWAGLLPP